MNEKEKPTFASSFSGIGGTDCGFERAGFRIIRHCEFDAFKSRVLRYHWPDAEHFHDINTIKTTRQADIEWGSPPCQDLSIAGKREGLGGRRSGLFHVWIDYLEANPPRELAVMEQVPGLFSSNDGKDFSDVLGAFTGWTPPIPSGGWRNSGVCFGPKGQTAWRTLNARYFGVAQRRARVFFIRDFRGERGPKILFEPKGGAGDFTPIGSKKNRTAADSVSGTINSSGAGTSIPAGQANEKDFCVVTGTIDCGYGKKRGSNQWIDPGKNFMQVVNTVKARYDSSPRSAGDGIAVAPTLRSGRPRPDSGGRPEQGCGNATLRTVPGNRGPQGKYGDLVSQAPNPNGNPDAPRVRQGLVRPADSKIYHATGDAVCVNVAEWIARRCFKEIQAHKEDLA